MVWRKAEVKKRNAKDLILVPGLTARIEGRCFRGHPADLFTGRKTCRYAFPYRFLFVLSANRFVLLSEEQDTYDWIRLMVSWNFVFMLI